MELIDKYNIYIRDSYDDLIFSGKEIDNYDLDKIFEYYSCIQLSKKYKQQFYEYNDIDSTFKEQNKMTRNDTGIDACNLIDTIVQCKLRKDSLRWEDCGTFFGSQNIFDSVLKKTIVKWDNLIITRNKECKLSKNLKEKLELFTDITYSRDEIIDYCNNLIKNPPKIKKIKDEHFKLRDYQLEAIEIINKNKNVIISLPTGCGKNVVIIYSINEKKRYLILVPRIILMEQIKTEIIKHRPDLKNKIKTIGDNNNEYDETKNITICVYNSVSVVEKYSESFDKIYIDEAHHINVPEIYEIEEIDDNESIEENDNIINDDESSVSDEEYYSEEDKESILKDDTEDEIKNTTGYNKIIKSFSKYNNNVYLSATIDEIKDFTYYKKDIRDMIDNKYLCDYTIHIPIFSDDPSNKNICEYLLRNYRNIIIYCNSQKEGKKINELLNTLQKGCSEYIDCKTSRTRRDKIIKSYKDGEIPFLVNVRILVEGFDAPITKGVCFIHLPSSKTTIIQIIGRALRLHLLKTYANIILPFSSKEDECNINKFLKILAQNDKRIKKTYESKTEGGYISIEKIKDEEDDKENDDIEFRYDMIYDSMGILQNGEEIWMNKYNNLIEWIVKNPDKKPSSVSNNKDELLITNWINNQNRNLNKNEGSMKKLEFKHKWIELKNKYPYIFDNFQQKWINMLNKIDDYMTKNKERPKKGTREYSWITGQIVDSKKKVYLLKFENIQKLWNIFFEKHKEIFKTTDEKWNDNYNELYEYIKINEILPHSKKAETKFLFKWLGHQEDNLIENKLSDEKKIKIEKLKQEFQSVFKTRQERWLVKLNELKEFINTNEIMPRQTKNDKNECELAHWYQNNNKNYNNNDRICKDPNIRKEWEKFENDYKKYFYNPIQLWISRLEAVKKYIDDNNKKPSPTDKNDENIKSLGIWLSRQNESYKNKYQIMKEPDIRTKWKEFITDPKYSIYF
jgi:superfamily II DNA/RNA helicase